MSKSFLTAEWRNLIMANYVVASEALESYLPVGTTLDLFEGRCYVSLVGFLFQNTRLKSVPVPFHRTFEEVNLRFYVQHMTAAGERRRGVVFISELVPRYALSVIANVVYGEPYSTVPLRHEWVETSEQRSVAYKWRHRGRWDELRVSAALKAAEIEPGSAEEFFTEHYWGLYEAGCVDVGVCGSASALENVSDPRTPDQRRLWCALWQRVCLADCAPAREHSAGGGLGDRGPLRRTACLC